ncbi:alpha-1,4-N-acetylglucosaminyltransferase-like [Lissotriton helveticus]
MNLVSRVCLPEISRNRGVRRRRKKQKRERIRTCYYFLRRVAMKTLAAGLLLSAISMCCYTFWKSKWLDHEINRWKSYLQETRTRGTANFFRILETWHTTGIFFVETSERLEPSALEMCSIESAARTYYNKPVFFLMKGLSQINRWNASYKALTLLSTFKNIKILPLRFDDVFRHTPMLDWYQKINPDTEPYWIHQLSDACRQVLLWKFGGIYMDTDVISLRPIQEEDFLAAESEELCSSAVLGFRRFHTFLWDCMEDFVRNYDGKLWGQQGPMLYTRMSERLCPIPSIDVVRDIKCPQFVYLHQIRFYPIGYQSWKKFFELWDGNDTLFHHSYALHFWNHMNNEHMHVTAGSNTVAEHLFQQHCPLTYDRFVKNAR